MNRKTIYAIILPFVFAFAFVKFISSDFLKDFVADPCDVAYLSSDFESKMAESSKNLEAQRVLNIARVRMSKIKGITAEMQEEALITFAVYGKLIEKGCKVPKEFEDKMLSYLVNEGDKVAKVCPEGAYRKYAEMEYNDWLSKKAKYQVFEQMAYEEFLESIGNPRAVKVFDKKWEDKEFRKRFLILSFQSNYRERDGCKEAYLLLKNEVLELMKEIVRE